MLKDFKPRLYQEKIFATTTTKNTLVVLPTGLGKTGIALLLAAHRLEVYPKSKVLLLAPTRPLAEQHLTTFKKHLTIPEDEIVLFTGFVKPEKRMQMWDSARVIISTPQGFENDIISNKNLLSNVSLIVFDEAHRAVKDYSYVFIAKQYEKTAKHTRILALTASPGSELENIEDICKNLFIDDLELRSENDEDVKEYVQDVEIEWLEVEFPEEFKIIKEKFESCSRRKLEEVKKLGYLEGNISSYTKKSLIALQIELRGRISSGEKNFEALKSISLLAEAMKVQHGLELLETQGLGSLEKYLEKLEEQSRNSNVKAVKNLFYDSDFLFARQKTFVLIEKKIEHPKIKLLEDKVRDEISKNKDAKIIIFTQFRSTASKIKKTIDGLKIKSKIFIGQANKEGEKGLSQKEQKEIIEEFSNGEFNCLISTSVGEEGLDIPQVDLVMFYEPIPSAIRSIQRRGRTGRLEKGKVYVLLTKNTRDEAYRWSAHHKENRMHRNLKKIKEDFKKIELRPNKDLMSYSKKEVVEKENEFVIHVDHREKGSPLLKALIAEGYEIKLKSLEIGDYLLSENIIVEFKTKKDFVDSIIDGRLLQQAKSLTKYLKPLIIVEGEEDIFSQRNIHENAIRGMISTLILSFKIPIIFTKNAEESKQYFNIIIKKEQEVGKDFQPHTSKPTTLREQQEYLVSALPNIGSALAKPLLKEFKSVKKIMLASEDKLKKVNLIGEKKAKKIRELIDEEYQPD